MLRAIFHPETGIPAQIKQVWTFARTHSLAETTRYLKSTDAPFIVQFSKYGACGVLAFVTHNGVAIWLSKTVFPAFEGLPAEELSRNQVYANLVALAISNIVAYVTNVLWVFTSGRHSRLVEFLLFSTVNAVSGAAGIFAGPAMRVVFGTNFWIAQATLIVTSTLVNFLCRKFLVFQK